MINATHIISTTQTISAISTTQIISATQIISTTGHPRKNFLSEFAQNYPNCLDLPRTAQKSPKLPKISQNAQNCPKCPELPRLVFRYVLLKHSERKFFLGRPVLKHLPNTRATYQTGYSILILLNWILHT